MLWPVDATVVGKLHDTDSVKVESEAAEKIFEKKTEKIFCDKIKIIW